MRRVPIGAVVLVVAMIGLFVVTNWGAWFGGNTPTKVIAIDADDPFAATPADDWADGEAGVVIPPVEPVGTHPATEVTDAYQRARAVVLAAMLDPAVIMGGDNEPYLRLFAPGDQADLRAALADPARVDRFLVRFGPGTTLLPRPPKVRGRMWAESAGAGKLLVRTRFVVAYPLLTDDGPRVEVARIDIDLTIVGPGRPAADRGVWLSRTEGSRSSTECDGDHSRAALRGSGEGVLPDALFDPDRPIESAFSCEG
ncbi:hypothetical protein [Alloactinosynnema sp. L-07]|uniref:hypothetical protein n=1 Tax=Alloactinosynnema sp. L-07 TaxID=1653480 RepID=UPI00065EF0E9|nr:hypothetical protein [Alloactinosynnema sp. L-07]CRK55400.1 hypothetical protein [Alloactinosynnema sp. L-07]